MQFGIMSYCNGRPKKSKSISYTYQSVHLSEALYNMPLMYNPVLKQLQFTDAYLSKSLYIRREMESLGASSSTGENPEPEINDKRATDGIGSSEDTNFNPSPDSHTNECSWDIENLEIVPKGFGVSEFFNRAVSVFVSDGMSRNKSWNIWSKSNSSNKAGEQKYSHVIASSTALIQQIRPSTLPAKDVREESRHRAEYNSIIREAHQREKREQHARQNEIESRFKREEAQAKRVKQWQEILPRLPKLKHHQHVRSLWWHGLPPCIRGRVWRLAFGNELQLTYKDYYSYVCKASIKVALNLGCSVDDILKIKYETADERIYQLFAANYKKNEVIHCTNGISNNCDNKPNITELVECPNIPKLEMENNTPSEQKNSNAFRLTYFTSNELEVNENPTVAKEISENSDTCLNVIQLDISRTFPSLGVFQKGCPYYPILHALLAAYVTYRPDIGYVQGMSFIAAVLLLNMEPPDAFIAFCNILDKPLHSAAFNLDQREMRAYFRAYDDLLDHCLPVLHAHFTQLGLSAELYCVDWLYSVYSRSMPFDIACRVWDLFARDGEEALFQTAVGILSYFQQNLLKMDFISAAQFLTRLPENINQDNLFKSIRKVQMKIGQTTFLKLLASYKGHV